MWDAFFEQLRERGRTGNLFVLIMVAIGVGGFFGTAGITVLLGVLAAYLVWLCVEIHRQRDRFERLGRQPPLASVDLKVARTKLANSKTQRLLNEQSQRLKTQRLVRSNGSGPLRLRPR